MSEKNHYINFTKELDLAIELAKVAKWEDYNSMQKLVDQLRVVVKEAERKHMFNKEQINKTALLAENLGIHHLRIDSKAGKTLATFLRVFLAIVENEHKMPVSAKEIITKGKSLIHYDDGWRWANENALVEDKRKK